MNTTREKLSTKVIALFAVLLLSLSALGLSQQENANANATALTPRATGVKVSVSCSSGGGYSWNATMVDGSPNTSYSVYITGYTYKDSSGETGSFATKYMGKLSTGKYGLGTSSTYYGNAGNGAQKVTIKAKVGNQTGSGSDTC